MTPQTVEQIQTLKSAIIDCRKKSKGQRIVFPRVIRGQCVTLLEAGCRVGVLATELGLSASALSRWRREAQETSARHQAKSSSQRNLPPRVLDVATSTPPTRPRSASQELLQLRMGGYLVTISTVPGGN